MFGFELLSRSQEVFFFLFFFFHIHMFDYVHFQYRQVFVSFLFLERSHFFWYGSSGPFLIHLFPLFIISMTHFCMPNSIYISSSSQFVLLRGSFNKFPGFFFVWALLLIVHTGNYSLLRSNLLQCNSLVVPFKQLLEGPMEVLLCERVTSSFHLLNCLITTVSECRE